MTPSRSTFPESTTVDLHDLAVILMYERMRHESKFSHFRLKLYHEGPLADLSPDDPLPLEEWDDPPHKGRPRKLYSLIRDDTRRDGDIVMKDGSSGVTPHSFLSTESLQLPPGMTTPLTYKQRELMYWRCKNYDSGYALTYAMQTVLDTLPDSTKLSVRTKNKRQNITITPPNKFGIMELEIRAHELAQIDRLTKLPGTTRAAIQTNVTGADGGFMPWVYIFLGEPTSADPDNDTRVALDLACTMLGARGPSGEVFALARGKEYLENTLASVADDMGGELKYSGRLAFTREDQAEVLFLAKSVLDRIRRIVTADEPFCAHCGSPASVSRCSK